MAALAMGAVAVAPVYAAAVPDVINHLGHIDNYDNTDY